MSAKLRTVLGALLLGLAAGGCGHPVSVAAGGTVRVALAEYRLNPSSDPRPRRLADDRGDQRRAADAQPRRLARWRDRRRRSGRIGPGQTGQLTVTLAPGTYLVGSTLLSDEALGLYGHVDRRRG